MRATLALRLNRDNMAYEFLSDFELTCLYPYIKDMRFKLYLGPC